MCCGDLCLLWLIDTNWGEDFTYFIHRCRGCMCHWWQLLYLGHDRTVIVSHLLCRRTEILKIWNKIGLKMSFTVYERPRVHEAEICSPCLPPYSIQYCHCLVALSSSPVKSTAQNMSAPSTQFDPSQINVLRFKGWGKEVQQCPDCCVFHHGEFLNNTRKFNVRRITIILHSSVFQPPWPRNRGYRGYL